MLKKIISGGQTGADQGGLEAGKLLGYETGGYAPWNWMTDDGPQEELLKSYGLIPAPYDPSTYRSRTKMNVVSSSGTLWIGNTESPGGKLTLGTCKVQDKPYIVDPTPNELLDFILTGNIEILNVAGNRERTNPGIKERTIELLGDFYHELGKFENPNYGRSGL